MKYFSKVSQESLTRYKRNPAICSIVCNYILLLKISDLKYHCHGNLVNFFPFWMQKSAAVFQYSVCGERLVLDDLAKRQMEMEIKGDLIGNQAI